MDLKKLKKKKKKQDALKIEYRKSAGLHVYRSEDPLAPFSEWTRLTEKPVSAGYFKDQYGEEGEEEKDFYYKFTEVDVHGNESEPRNPTEQFWRTKDGEKIERKPETTVFGHNVYWSIDPDLPLDQWTKLNEKPYTDNKTLIHDPVLVPFYIYAKWVNELGEEFGNPSKIQKLVPRLE